MAGVGGIASGIGSAMSGAAMAEASMEMAKMADPIRALEMNPYKGGLQSSLDRLQGADPLQYMRGLMSGRVNLAPGYGFQRQQGLEALTAADAAAGRTGSGAALAAAEKYGQGLASTAFSDAWNRQAGLQNVASTQLQNVLAGYLGASGQSAQLMNAGTAAAAQGMQGLMSGAGLVGSGIGGIGTGIGKLWGSSAPTSVSDPGYSDPGSSSYLGAGGSLPVGMSMASDTVYPGSDFTGGTYGPYY